MLPLARDDGVPHAALEKLEAALALSRDPEQQIASRQPWIFLEPIATRGATGDGEGCSAASIAMQEFGESGPFGLPMQRGCMALPRGRCALQCGDLDAARAAFELSEDFLRPALPEANYWVRQLAASRAQLRPLQLRLRRCTGLLAGARYTMM